MKLRDYEFKSIFNELKGIYPTLKLEFKEDTSDDGYDEIRIVYDGSSIFNEEKIEVTSNIVSFIETYGYKMSNPLCIYLSFKVKKGEQIDFRKFEWTNDGKQSRPITTIKDMNDYIGEQNLSYIRIKTEFVGFEALEGDYMEQIKDLQNMFDGKDGYKLMSEEEIFSKFLNKCPVFEYEGNIYWLYGGNYNKDIVNGNYTLITKIAGKMKVVGGCKIKLYSTKYRMEEIFILPKYRKKGYSLVLNKFIQEKTGLAYDTGGDRTKLGFYQMLRNKRVLKYESFVNKMY